MASNIASDDRCRRCWSQVGPRQKSICCDICNRWFHFKCSKLTNDEFKLLLKIVIKSGDVHTVKFIGVKNVLRS